LLVASLAFAAAPEAGAGLLTKTALHGTGFDTDVGSTIVREEDYPRPARGEGWAGFRSILSLCRGGWRPANDTRPSVELLYGPIQYAPSRRTTAPRVRSMISTSNEIDQFSI
jgi:hypothetical protein